MPPQLLVRHHDHRGKPLAVDPAFEHSLVAGILVEKNGKLCGDLTEELLLELSLQSYLISWEKHIYRLTTYISLDCNNNTVLD